MVKDRARNTVYFDPEILFPETDKIKTYFFNLSPKYDILLGHETLNEPKANITLKKKKLLVLINNKRVKRIKIKTRLQCNYCVCRVDSRFESRIN